jgi:hypothetical protein
MGANNLTQIHDSPSRENNLLDLAGMLFRDLISLFGMLLFMVPNRCFLKISQSWCTSSPFFCFSSTISFSTDFETKVHHQNTTPKKCYIYSKANWNTINKDINTLNEIVEEKPHYTVFVHSFVHIYMYFHRYDNVTLSPLLLQYLLVFRDCLYSRCFLYWPKKDNSNLKNRSNDSNSTFDRVMPPLIKHKHDRD